MDRILALGLGVFAVVALGYGASVGAAAPADDAPPAPPPPFLRGREAPPPAAPRGAEGAASGSEVTWQLLQTYEYQQNLAGLPDAIKALHGKHVTMRGFLMPLTEWDDIHEFSLVQSHMSCCFGMVPGFSGQVLVKIRSKRGLPNTNEPIEVTGTFRVEEVKEVGFLLAIFSITDAEARIVGY
jgi:hypothetical protein